MFLVAGLESHGVSLGDIIVAASVIGGWLIKYAQNNDKAEVHTKVLDEHGAALDKLVDAIHELAMVDVRMDEQTKTNRDLLKDVHKRVDRLEERILGRYEPYHSNNP